MFGLLKSTPFSDPALGELVRSHGLWRGTIPLDSGLTPLALAGTPAGRTTITRYAAAAASLKR
jgi:hypothetical protein